MSSECGQRTCHKRYPHATGWRGGAAARRRGWWADRGEYGVVLDELLEVEGAEQHRDQGVEGLGDGGEAGHVHAEAEVEGHAVGDEEDGEEDHEPEHLARSKHEGLGEEWQQCWVARSSGWCGVSKG